MAAVSVGDGKGGVQITISELRSELAPLKASLEFVVSEATDPWEIIHTEISNIAKTRSTSYRDQICDFYGISKTHYCMVLGKASHCDIVSAHIWPNHTGGHGLDTFGLTTTDLTNPRNFLRLHDKIEKAFDRKHLTFLPANDFNDGASDVVSLMVVILNPALLFETLAYNEESIDMESLDGKIFHHNFPVDKTPFLRLLAVHALRAHQRAVEYGWILNNTMLAERKARARDLARRSLEQNDPKFVMQRFFNDI